MKKKTLNFGQECEGQLDPEMLTQGETYEARVRVRATRSNVEGIWSEWSPTLIWVSSEGRPKSPSGKTYEIEQMWFLEQQLGNIILNSQSMYLEH